MAEKVKFQPQTFDINSINDGNRFGYEGIQPEAVNAPIEAAAYMQALATNQPDNSEAGLIGEPTVSIEKTVDGTPQFKFSNLRGADHSEEIATINQNIAEIQQEQKTQNEKIAENKVFVDMLLASSEQNNQFYKATIEESFTTRQTANGLTVIDPSPAIVKKIKGKTVKSSNIFNKANITKSDDFPNCKEIEILDDNNVLIARGYTSTATEFNYATGWVRPNMTVAQTKGLSLKNGDTITISADFTLIEQGDKSAKVRCYVYNAAQTFILTPANAKSISKTKTRLSWSFTITKDDTTYYPVFPINSNKVRIENIAIKYGEDATYTSYFNGLKHAFIDSIKSTGRNLINQDLLIGKSGVSKAIFEGYDCIKMTAGQAILPFYCKAGQAIRLSADFAYENGIAMYWAYLYADGTLSNDLYSLSISSGNSSFERKTSIAIVPQKDVVGIEITRNGESMTVYIKDVMMNYGETAEPYVPYIEDVYQLPETLELAEWDYINPQKGEYAKGTRTIVCDGTENWQIADATYNTYKLDIYPKVSSKRTVIHSNTPFGVRASGGNSTVGWSIIEIHDSTFASVEKLKSYLASNPVTISYELKTPTIETLTDYPKGYQAKNGGSETVEQGDTDNSQWGAIPTTEIQYYVLGGNPNES